ADWKADGLKTGHTTEAGYVLVGSAVMNDRRVIFAIGGLPSDKDRAAESEAIVNWAFRQFTKKTLIKAGTRVAEAPVWLGAAESVALAPAEDVTLLMPSQVQESIIAEVIYNGPFEAPIAKGTQIAEMVIHVPNLPDARIPLVAEADVAEGGLLKRLSTAANVLIRRYIDGTPNTAPAS
ncbi:MAG: D-alanyl-D-alanine carboxypeptidase, partial [Rhodobacteraceae bacterium]|nr:D-alanyl-D-alanine carboxypeptidase [Paracoccaceae bacterium]